MKVIVFFAGLFFLPGLLFSQEQEFVVNNTLFVITADSVKNEWESYDKIKKLYRKEKRKMVYLLSFYSYKDEGGDCNNLFWNEETLTIQNDSLVFLTHYLQKTGIDPIPEWRKQVYVVNREGRLNLVYDHQKYYRQEEWVQTKQAD